MICVGIDVAKDKHDCFILSSEGEVLADVFTIPNNAEGFDTLLQTIHRCARPEDKIKVGLEATGHYSYNILGFLLDKGLHTFVINPLHTNLYRKSLSLRKTKTDRVDARTIAAMLMSDVDLKSYTDTAYHNEELKSLTRYRFDKVKERAKLKQSVSRLVTILFPELEKLVPTLHMASVYALLSEFPGAKQIARAHLTHLKALLNDASKGRYRLCVMDGQPCGKTAVCSLDVAVAIVYPDDLHALMVFHRLHSSFLFACPNLRWSSRSFTSFPLGGGLSNTSYLFPRPAMMPAAASRPTSSLSKWRQSVWTPGWS